MYIKQSGLILIPVTHDILSRLIKVIEKNDTLLAGEYNNTYQKDDGIKFELSKGNTVKLSTGWVNDFKKSVHLFIEELKDPTITGWSVWFVIERETNTIIGDAGFKGKPDNEGLVEIGYQINSAYRNKGYATTAVKGLIEWAFNHNDVRKVIAECHNDNFASIRVLEKAGLKKIRMKGKMIKWEIIKPSFNDFNSTLIGYCGFYCGSCPTYLKSQCTGCRLAHDEGDCYTNSCVKKKDLRFCGECSYFPCEEIIIKEKLTILDPAWLKWKKREKENNRGY